MCSIFVRELFKMNWKNFFFSELLNVCVSLDTRLSDITRYNIHIDCEVFYKSSLMIIEAQAHIITWIVSNSSQPAFNTQQVKSTRTSATRCRVPDSTCSLQLLAVSCFARLWHWIERERERGHNWPWAWKSGRRKLGFFFFFWLKKIKMLLVKNHATCWWGNEWVG